MGDFIFLFVLFFFGLLILDLAIVAAYESLSKVSWARLASQKEEYGSSVEHTLMFLKSSMHETYTFPSLRLIRMITIILLFGFIFIALINLLPKPVGTSLVAIFPSFVLPILIIFGLFALLLTWVEILTVEHVEQNIDKWAIRITYFARVVNFIFYPLLFVPLSWVIKIDVKKDHPSLVTEDELKSMVDASEQGGVLEQDERKMIYSIFELGDTLVREIMVPRIDIVAIDIFANIDESTNKFLDSGYSRVPVYEETIDNIKGVLYAKDLLKAWRTFNTLSSLSDLLRPAYFVPEAKKVDKLLAEMQSMRVHMAIAVDEYGGVAGLVTLEDIVEEIVGEIRDEYDDLEDLYYYQPEQDEYVCSGRMNLDDVNELLNYNLPVDEADTLAGLIYSRIGHVPIQEEKVIVNDLILTIEQVANRRISKVRIRRLIPPNLVTE
ncbi:MAG: hemolysin family protein [Chloroflexota bacterium]|jgi:CBS domain containing-hemolysin-like protein